MSDLQQYSKPELISIIVELRQEMAEFKKFHEEQMAEVRKELSEVKQELFLTRQELAETKKELAETKKELAETKKELAETKVELVKTKAELASTQAELVFTKAKLAIANSELAKYKQPKKDSRNSSLPPSQDFATPKRTQSLRESSKKKRRTARP
jgi:septal ring factor EnvC (AmiA/AmiB activator)